MMTSATSQRKPHTRRATLLSAAAAMIAITSASLAQVPVPSGQNTLGLPAAQPTQNQSFTPIQAPTAEALHAYRARVELRDNQLTIAADNSSLNGILNEIAKLTGMKITGGVAEERVYGSYGPDSAEVVLNQLLDGTGANVLLLETSQHTLAELVLTPRNGGPTPPSPNASRDDGRNQDNVSPGFGGRRRDLFQGGRRDRINDPAQESRAPDPAQQPQPMPQPFTPGATPDTGAQLPDASQQPSNGFRTPQQIYDDMARQQQQRDLQQQQREQQQQQVPTIPPQ